MTRVTLAWNLPNGVAFEARGLRISSACPKCGTLGRRVAGLDERERRYVPVTCALCEEMYALPAVVERCPGAPLLVIRERPEPLRVPVEPLETPARELPATTHVAFGRTPAKQPVARVRARSWLDRVLGFFVRWWL